MNPLKQELDDLAARARGGDAAALAGLRRELEPRMPLIVRQVLRSGQAATPFQRQVLRTARHLTRYAGGPQAGDGDRLVRRVASSVLESLLERVGAPPASQRMKETVLM